MKSGKRFIGMFHTEPELLAKVKELKTEGYTDHQIFVLAKSEDNVKMLQSRTDAEIQTTHESWLDKFMDFMTGEDRVRELMEDLGFSENEKAGFYQEVNEGSMLLYVDEQNDRTGQHQETGRRFESVDPAMDGSVGKTTWIAPPGDGVTRTPEEPAFGHTQSQKARDLERDSISNHPIERSEFSVAADDTISNGLEVTDFAGELGKDPEEDKRRQEFQESINDTSRPTKE